MTKNELYDKLLDGWSDGVESWCVSEETLRVVTNINGFTTETLNDVIYAVSGYRYWGQWNTGEEA